MHSPEQDMSIWYSVRVTISTDNAIINKEKGNKNALNWKYCK